MLRYHLPWFAHRDADDHNVPSGDSTGFMNHSESPSMGEPSGAVEGVHSVAQRNRTDGEESTCDDIVFDREVAKKRWGQADAGRPSPQA